MFMTFTTGMIIFLSITAAAAVFVQTGARSASNVPTCFVFILGSVFAFAFTSMQHIYLAEFISNDLKTKGMGTSRLQRALLDL
jgi:hypothetical protein